MSYLHHAAGQVENVGHVQGSGVICASGGIMLENGKAIYRHQASSGKGNELIWMAHFQRLSEKPHLRD